MGLQGWNISVFCNLSNLNVKGNLDLPDFGLANQGIWRCFSKRNTTTNNGDVDDEDKARKSVSVSAPSIL